MPTTLQQAVDQEDLLTVSEAAVGSRLDRFIAAEIGDISRSQVQRSIRLGLVTVDGITASKTGLELRHHQQVGFVRPPVEPVVAEPEDIPVNVLFEDDHIIVVNKPAGMVVHPAAGHHRGTLVNALLGRNRQLAAMGPLRPGIVHRLDKGTSGVLVVAKTQSARERLSNQFLQRRVFKGYLCLVLGCPKEPEGRIEQPIARHPKDRKRFTSKGHEGRAATTLWRRVANCRGVALLAVRILSGRTHQIRVHLSDFGFPVVGDDLYCPTWQRRVDRPLRQVCAEHPEALMLQAAHLGIAHPATGAPMSFAAPLAPHISEALENLFPDWPERPGLTFHQKDYFPEVTDE